ncbi:MAG: sulfatase [Myxococcota bacterium]
MLLIVLDTFRADRMGAYGNERGLTPFLDELAARGVLFERAYSTSAWTPPSVASLLTSRYPTQHRVQTMGSVLGAAELTLAETLQAADYRAAGFSSNIYVREAAGFGQGFDPLRLYVALERAAKRRADFLRAQALSWLDSTLATDDARPIFLYLHFMDAHSPYEPPEAFRQRFAPRLTATDQSELNRLLDDVDNPERWALLGERREDVGALYDAEVASLDGELAQLFRDLEARRFLEHAVIVIVADHGEELGEHGRFLHGSQLFEESVRVPLLIAAPGVEGGRRVEAPVSLVDVAPTILALLDQPVPEPFEGRSLLPLVEDPRPDGRDVHLDSGREGWSRSSATHTLGLVRGSRKLLVDPSGGARLYDLGADPGEEAPREPTAAETDLRASLERARRHWADTSGRAEQAPRMDEETLSRLRAFGYAVEEPAAEAH